jgi:hypothetical protein
LAAYEQDYDNNILKYVNENILKYMKEKKLLLSFTEGEL